MDYPKNTPLSPLHGRSTCTYHSTQAGTACLRSSSSEQPKCSNEPPTPTATAVKLGGGRSLCPTEPASALGQQQRLQTGAVTTLQRGGQAHHLFCRAWLLRASRLDPRNLLGRAQLRLVFSHTSDSGICIWYLSAHYVGCPTVLTVCYALKIEFLVT